ncbi:hypothetical protein ASD65_03790 [Microbacterium sp. Root61]|nr:hypothetical protein ASD65_03790 [Microbacterium sp. Root61]
MRDAQLPSRELTDDGIVDLCHPWPVRGCAFRGDGAGAGGAETTGEGVGRDVAEEVVGDDLIEAGPGS